MTSLDFLPEDILTLIFEHLMGDYSSLSNIGLTSQRLRRLSLPCLLHNVDISFHNLGRLTKYECEVLPQCYADFGPHNGGHAFFRHIAFDGVLPRQEAFRSLLSQRPELSRWVKRFTWTLTWGHWAGTPADPELRIWEVFSLLTNVTHLDLAVLHNSGDVLCVRQNPPILFPRVTHLRLVGHMHRALVQAIIQKPKQIRSLNLHYTEDEGSLPNGLPLSIEQAEMHDHAYTKRNSDAEEEDVQYRSGIVIDEQLFQRQASGQAWVFPGPMWLPLRLLSREDCSSLTSLHITMTGFVDGIDFRNFNTMAQEISNTLFVAKRTLETVKITIGDHSEFWIQRSRGGCGTRRLPLPRALGRSEESYREVLAAFLNRILPFLQEEGHHPNLSVELKGFSLLDCHPDNPDRADEPGPSDENRALFALVQNCPAVDGASMNEINVDYHYPFEGHDYTGDVEYFGYVDLLQHS